MSWIIYALHGGVAQSEDEREFPGEYTLMFHDTVRVSHQYARGHDIMVAVNVPSVDFLNFEVTKTVDEKGGQVWVAMASADEVRDRLFIRDHPTPGGVAPGPDPGDIELRGGDKDFEFDVGPATFRVSMPKHPESVVVIKGIEVSHPKPPHLEFAQEESDAAT